MSKEKEKTPDQTIDALLDALQKDAIEACTDPESLKKALDEAQSRPYRDQEFDSQEDDRSAGVRCGLYFRRTPSEVKSGNLCLPGNASRAGILIAYCGCDDGDAPEKWVATAVQYYGAWWDKKARKWQNPAIRTVQPFAIACRDCGTSWMAAGEVRKSAEKLLPNGVLGKKDTVVDNLVSLGDICPHCGKHAMASWRQLDLAGEDGDIVYGHETMSWIRRKVLDASGDLDIPPVVGYVGNGVPGSLDRLPSTTMVGTMDRLAELAGSKGAQVVSFDDLTPEDEILGVDLVSPEICTGLVDPEELGNGIKSGKGDRYAIDIVLHTRAALAGRPYVFPSSDNPYPGDKRPPREKRGWFRKNAPFSMHM